MRPHFWFEFTDKRKLFIFVAITVVIFLYWNFLMLGALGRFSQDRRLILVTIYLHFIWFFGWAIALFGKAQDQDFLTDYDFDRLRRIASNAMIIIATLGFMALFIFSKRL